MDVYRIENNIKEQRAVFKYVRIDTTFARWIKNLSKNTLVPHLKNDTFKANDILRICANANRNFEVLKLVIYAILKTELRYSQITHVSGKDIRFIRDIAKLLHATISPTLNKEYLTDYHARFPSKYIRPKIPIF